jgi:hypothetical protein
MKLATFIDPSQHTVIGAVDTASQTVLALQAAHRQNKGSDSPHLVDMLALMDGAEPALALARDIERLGAGAGPHRHALASVKLLAPVPVPRQIRDFNNAEDHMRNAPAGMQMLVARMKGQPVPARSEVQVSIPDVNFAQPIFYISNRNSWSILASRNYLGL